MVDLMKSMPFTLAAYVVIAFVLTAYFASLVIRFSRVRMQSEHLDSFEEKAGSVVSAEKEGGTPDE